MFRVDYRESSFSMVRVCGILCEFHDMRIYNNTVPEGKYKYEVAGDDDVGDDPARVKLDILVNFLGTLVCDEPLPIGEDGVLWLYDGDFMWL